MSVRRAVPADAAPIAQIHVRSWQAAYRGLMPDDLLDGLSADERAQTWREALADNAVFVTERDGALVGFCALAEPSRDEDAPDGTAEIGAIYVDPQAWRAGAGRALMDAALRHLQASGWREATLWVLRENEQALDFYAKFGFAPDGAEKSYTRSGTTGLRMRRSL